MLVVILLISLTDPMFISVLHSFHLISVGCHKTMVKEIWPSQQKIEGQSDQEHAEHWTKNVSETVRTKQAAHQGTKASARGRLCPKPKKPKAKHPNIIWPLARTKPLIAMIIGPGTSANTTPSTAGFNPCLLAKIHSQ